MVTHKDRTNGSWRTGGKELTLLGFKKRGNYKKKTGKGGVEYNENGKSE